MFVMDLSNYTGTEIVVFVIGAVCVGCLAYGIYDAITRESDSTSRIVQALLCLSAIVFYCGVIYLVASK